MEGQIIEQNILYKMYFPNFKIFEFWEREDSYVEKIILQIIILCIKIFLNMRTY